MQTTSPPRWLMIVSIATAVLPVWRSPMISSRWPRPIGIIASMALRPVCSGSFTGWRSTTPGALNSSGRVSVVSIAGPPSMGIPRGATTRPIRAALAGVALLDLLPLAEQHGGDVVLFEVEGEPGDAVVELELLERDAAAQPV